MKHVVVIACALQMLHLGALPAGAEDRAAKINWQKYMQSAANVAAIAAAVALVDNCSKKPLLIEEMKSGDGKLTLVFTCNGNEDEEASSIVQFEDFGGRLFPRKFDLAG